MIRYSLNLTAALVSCLLGWSTPSFAQNSQSTDSTYTCNCGYVHKNIERVKGTVGKYPALALRAGIEGRVYLRFTIDSLGQMKGSVLKGLGYGCDEEALKTLDAVRFTVHCKQDWIRLKEGFHGVDTMSVRFKML